MFKRLIWLLITVVGLLSLLLLFNTLRFTSVQLQTEVNPTPPVQDVALERLTRAVQIPTISFADPAKFDSSAFLSFRRMLEVNYPRTHQALHREVMGKYSLLFTWPGSVKNLKPIIILAHQDVVPVEEESRSMWHVDPFGGIIREGYVWGRGTTDNKTNLISLFEAVEKLLANGFAPNRTLYLVLGHDEELGGRGAKAIADTLLARHVHADLVLDEGGIITREKVPGITAPVALLGTAEKGSMSLLFTVNIPGGHSSMPVDETSLDVLSIALVKLRSHPFDAKVTRPFKDLQEAIGPELPFFKKLAFANPWLFERVIIREYAKSAAGNAMVRTTLVPTIIHAGSKDNVIPTQASAVLNIRLLPGDSSSDILRQIKTLVDDDRVMISSYRGAITEGSSVTDASSEGYMMVAAVLRQSIKDVIVSPFLMIGATDSRHFSGVSQTIIRFSPMIDPVAFHGIDERVSIESFQKSMWFYEQLIRRL